MPDPESLQCQSTVTSLVYQLFVPSVPPLTTGASDGLVLSIAGTGTGAGTSSHHYGLAMLRVRGIDRVRLHADLIMLSRLSLALARVRSR